MGSFINTSADSATNATRAYESRTQGILQRNRAYQQAYGLEQESAQNNYIAGRQMLDYRARQTAAVAASRAQNGASGFSASGGTKLGVETSVLDLYARQIEQLGTSAAINDQNARAQANELRREGDTAKSISDIRAEHYDRIAKSQRVARWGFLLGDTLSTAGQMQLQYNLLGSNLKPSATK